VGYWGIREWDTGKSVSGILGIRDWLLGIREWLLGIREWLLGICILGVNLLNYILPKLLSNYYTMILLVNTRKK
jgi:energy-converting hydrogenase Eha subunit G